MLLNAASYNFVFNLVSFWVQKLVFGILAITSWIMQFQNIILKCEYVYISTLTCILLFIIVVAELQIRCIFMKSRGSHYKGQRCFFVMRHFYMPRLFSVQAKSTFPHSLYRKWRPVLYWWSFYSQVALCFRLTFLNLGSSRNEICFCNSALSL